MNDVALTLDIMFIQVFVFRNSHRLHWRFTTTTEQVCRTARMTIFSPDGAADYMRTRLNRMCDATFARFIEYLTLVSVRSDLIRAGSYNKRSGRNLSCEGE